MSNDDSWDEFPPTKRSGPRRRHIPNRQDLIAQSRNEEETLTDPLHAVPDEMLERFAILGETGPTASPNTDHQCLESQAEPIEGTSKPSASELLERLENPALGMEDAIAEAVRILSDLLQCESAYFLFPQQSTGCWVVLSSMGEGAGDLLLQQLSLPAKTTSALDEVAPDALCINGSSFVLRVISGKPYLLDHSDHDVLLNPIPLPTSDYALMVAISASGQGVFDDDAKAIARELQQRLSPHLARLA